MPERDPRVTHHFGPLPMRRRTDANGIMITINKNATDNFNPMYWADSMDQWFDQWWVEAQIETAWQEHAERTHAQKGETA